jgi:hypothetical protein
MIDDPSRMARVSAKPAAGHVGARATTTLLAGFGSPWLDEES